MFLFALHFFISLQLQLFRECQIKMSHIWLGNKWAAFEKWHRLWSSSIPNVPSSFFLSMETSINLRPNFLLVNNIFPLILSSQRYHWRKDTKRKYQNVSKWVMHLRMFTGFFCSLWEEMIFKNHKDLWNATIDRSVWDFL